MKNVEAVKKIVLAGFPDAEVEVSDMTGTGDHFQILVISEAFAGKSLIEQHRSVHALLEKEMNNFIHAVKIRTRTPSQKNSQSSKSSKQEWSGRHARPGH